MHGTVTVAVSLTPHCTVRYQHSISLVGSTEAESIEKHGVWDPMPELTVTLCPLQSGLQHIYHGQLYARVDLIPESGTLDLASVLL